MKYYAEHNNPERVLWYWNAISGYLWLHGWYFDYILCDTYALAAARSLPDDGEPGGRRLECVIHAELAYAFILVDDIRSAGEHLREAETIARSSGDIEAIIRTLRYRAVLSIMEGKLGPARDACLEAFRFLERAVWQSGEEGYAHATMEGETFDALTASTHTVLGIIYMEQKRFDDARRELLGGLKFARRIRGTSRTYWSLSPLLNLGCLAELQSRVSRAGYYYEQCIQLTRDGTCPDIRVRALLGKVRLARHQGNLAYDLLFEAMHLCDRIGEYGLKTEATWLLRNPPCQDGSSTTIKFERGSLHVPL